MSTELEILFPEKEVRLAGDQKIFVRELNHRKATRFLTLLAGYVPKIYDAKGDVSFSAETITTLATTTEELSNFLIQEASGLNPEDLPLSISIEVLRAALEINLSPEIIEKGKKLAGVFQDLAGRAMGPKAPAPASAKSTISSAKAAITSAPT